MKKVIVLLIGLFVLALAVPAMAGDDFDLDVDIEKEKFVGIDIDKWVDVKVDVKSNAKEAAEAEAVMNQENDQNVAIEALGLSMGVMGNSVNANEGITGVNQATGNLNNQGNVAAVAVTLDGEEEATNGGDTCIASFCGDDNRGGRHYHESGEPFVDAEAFVVQENDENELYKIVTGSAAAMGTSVNDNTGIVGVNQASGSLNNQANAVAIAAGLDGVDVALAESALGQTNTGSGNFLVQVGYEATGFICGSISGNSGVVGVNQAAGNMNNQANVVSISAGPAF